MIEKISLAIVGESGAVIPIQQSDERLDIKIDAAIADTFSQICFRNNSIEDAEIKTSEKFLLLLNLYEFQKEMKRNEA